jgi:hypothetical protein
MLDGTAGSNLGRHWWRAAAVVVQHHLACNWDGESGRQCIRI